MNFRGLTHVNSNLAHPEWGLGICIFSRHLMDCDGNGLSTMFAGRAQAKEYF